MPDSEPPSTIPPLNAALLSVARQLFPTPSTVLRPGDPVLDPIYGGRVADIAGGPSWGYYSVHLPGPNGTTHSGGTTCGIVLAYELARAGWPKDMVNRSRLDPVAPGSGFTPGMHISKIVGGAKQRGWYRDPTSTPPQPGDAYHEDHPPRPNSDHVGGILSVSDPRADGTRQVITFDGGAGTGADAQLHTRTLSADGQSLSLDGVPARVLGWIRADPNTRPLDTSQPIA